MYTFLNLGEIGTWDRFELEAVCRAQAQSAYLGNRIGLCRVLGRYKFYVDTRDIGFGSHVLLDGFWEMWLTQFIARHVKPGMVVADVGANFGYYSLLLADLVGEDGHVYAVEPNPHAAQWLRRSLSLNGLASNVTICEAAAGDSDGGDISLFVPEDEPKNATVAHGDTGGQAGVIHTVSARTLDSLTAAHERIDFLKIDAEGAEEAILRGMAGLVERCKPAIVLEFNTARYDSPRDFLAALARHYPAFKAIDHAGAAVPVTMDQILERERGEDWLLFLQA